MQRPARVAALSDGGTCKKTVPVLPSGFFLVDKSRSFRRFQTKICCHWLEFRLIASKFLTIVLGGTAALHTCSGVGGGHFLITKSSRGDRTNSATLIFSWFSFAPPFLFSFFVGLYFVSNAEGHLPPALNVLFWNQVVEANQSIPCALGPFIS
jgi:hypothetical protein